MKIFDTKLNKYKNISCKDIQLMTLLDPEYFFVLSAEETINRAYCEERGIRFHYAQIGQKSKAQVLDEVHQGEYYYIGDSLADYECLKGAKHGFLPQDASKTLLYKLSLLPDQENKFTVLNVASGHGVVDAAIANMMVRELDIPWKRTGPNG